MRERIDIAHDVVSCKGNLRALQDELSQYPWDHLPEPIINITVNDISTVVHRAISGEIAFTELEEWANLIECRDDFSFQHEELQESIFELANPIISGEINKESLISLSNWLQILSS